MVFRLFMGILQMGIDASVVIALVILARMLLGKAPKKYAYLLWIIVGIQLVCPVKITSPFSIYNLLPQTSDRMEQSLEKYAGISRENVRLTGKTRSQIKSVSDDQSRGRTDTVPNNGQTDRTVSDDSSSNIQTNSKTEAGKNADNKSDRTYSSISGDASGGMSDEASEKQSVIFSPAQLWRMLHGAAYLWLAVLCMILIVNVILYLRMEGRVATAVRMQDSVYECDAIPSPFVMGLLSPRIYIPFRLGEQEKDYIIRHEKYHIRRRDNLVKVAAFLLCSIYWFQPLVWLSYFLMIRDMEMSCDEYVLQNSPEDIRAAYSESLLQFATNRRSPGMGMLTFGETDTRRRVKHVMKFRKHAKWIGAAAVVVILAVGIFGLTNAVNPGKDTGKTGSGKAGMAEDQKDNAQKESDGLPVIRVLDTDGNVPAPGETQGGWYGDILRKRFGVKLYIMAYDYAKNIDEQLKSADIVIWKYSTNPDYLVARHQGLIEDIRISNETYAQSVMAISKTTQQKQLCQKLAAYFDSPKARMEACYGPEELCWYYKNHKAYLTDVGVKCQKDLTYKLDTGISTPETYQSGHRMISYMPYDPEAIDPNTGEAYGVLYDTYRTEKSKKKDMYPDFMETSDKKSAGSGQILNFTKGLVSIRATYHMDGYEAFGTRTLDEWQLKQVSEWLDETYYRRRKKPDPDKSEDELWSKKWVRTNYVTYELTYIGGKHAQMRYYPGMGIFCRNKDKWYDGLGNAVGRTSFPADQFQRGSGKDKTKFYIYGKTYDMRKQDAGVEAVISCKIMNTCVAVYCRMKEGEETCFIYDCKERRFVRKLQGVIWEDFMYISENGVIRNYAGEKIRRVSLREGEKISAFYEDWDHKNQWTVQFTDVETGDTRDVKANIKVN